MRLRAWIREIYLTEAHIVTGKSKLRFKPALISGSIFFLFILLLKALLGGSKVNADESSYKPVGADTVAQQGQVLLKFAGYEVRKKGGSTRGSDGPQASETQELDQGQVISRKERATSEYVLPAGTKISVTLEGDLNSQLSQSPVVAHVNNSFSFRGKVLIPSGTKALGKVEETQDSGRISVHFDQLVYPNGGQISAQSMAMMEDGSPGVVGDYHSGNFGKFATSVGLSFLSGGAAALETTTANAFGFQQPDVSTRNVVLNGLAKSTLDHGQRMGEEAQNKKGYVTLPSGSGFQIYFDHEVNLTGGNE